MDLESFEKTQLEKDLKAVVRVYRGYPELRKQAMQEFRKTEREESDLLHALELINLDAVGMSKITKQLIATLQRRRGLKDMIEYLDAITPLKNRVPTQQSVGTAISSINQIHGKFQTRKYRIKEKEELRPLFAEKGLV